MVLELLSLFPRIGESSAGERESDVPHPKTADNELQPTKGAPMGSPILMSLSEVDSAIARNIMKWRRLTRSALQSDIGLSPNPQQYGQSLDPHWFDLEGRIVAMAETTESREGTNGIWSPTGNPVDAQM